MSERFSSRAVGCDCRSCACSYSRSEGYLSSRLLGWRERGHETNDEKREEPADSCNAYHKVDNLDLVSRRIGRSKAAADYNFPCTASSAVLGIIAISALVRVLLASVFGLGVDEAYTVGVARHFAWSYFDHPPLHVWLVGGWARIIGSENAFVLRIPFIGLFAASSWLMFRLASMVFGQRAGMWSVLVFNLAPEFGLSTGSWILPDGPLVFFLLAAGVVLVRLLVVDPDAKKPPSYWLIAGASGGFGLLSKYTAVFLFSGVFIFLVTTWQGRRCLATAGPWLGAALAAIMFLPVVAWNMQHHWISFVFQGSRASYSHFNLNWILQYLGGQLGYLLPWIFAPLACVLWQALQRGRSCLGSWLLACLAVGPIAIFTIVAFWARALPHWPAAGWLFAIPLLGEAMARVEQTRPRLLFRLGLATALIEVIVLAALASQSETGLISAIEPRLFAKSDPTLMLSDWRALKPKIEKLDVMRDASFVAGLNWIESGELNYAIGPDVQVLCLCPEPHQFSLMKDPATFNGRDGMIIGTAKLVSKSLPELARHFRRIEAVTTVNLASGRVPGVELQIFRGVEFTSAGK